MPDMQKISVAVTGTPLEDGQTCLRQAWKMGKDSSGRTLFDMEEVLATARHRKGVDDGGFSRHSA